MNQLDIFLQHQDHTEVTHMRVPATSTVAALKATLIERKLASEDSSLYLEDSDEPLEEAKRLESLGAKALKVHANRCKRIEVTVTFATRTVDRKFSPSTTVAAVHRWATKELGLAPDDATEQELQLKGTHERPSSATHVGSLARHCAVAFDLVPNDRIQG